MTPTALLEKHRPKLEAMPPVERKPRKRWRWTAIAGALLLAGAAAGTWKLTRPAATPAYGDGEGDPADDHEVDQRDRDAPGADYGAGGHAGVGHYLRAICGFQQPRQERPGHCAARPVAIPGATRAGAGRLAEHAGERAVGSEQRALGGGSRRGRTGKRGPDCRPRWPIPKRATTARANWWRPRWRRRWTCRPRRRPWTRQRRGSSRRSHR